MKNGFASFFCATESLETMRLDPLVPSHMSNKCDSSSNGLEKSRQRCELYPPKALESLRRIFDYAS